MPHCNPFIALWIQRTLGRVTNPHNVPERWIWHLDLWFSCQICKITCNQTTPWGLHSCERWRVRVIPTRLALICAQMLVPSSCPFATLCNFQHGSEGLNGVTPVESSSQGLFQVQLRWLSKVALNTYHSEQRTSDLLRPLLALLSTSTLLSLLFSFPGSFSTQWPHCKDPTHAM